MIFVQHVRSACFDLGIDNSFPKFVSFHSPSSFALSFVLKVKLFKFLPMSFSEALSLIRTE